MRGPGFESSLPDWPNRMLQKLVEIPR
jgi:hypothetical protein